LSVRGIRPITDHQIFEERDIDSSPFIIALDEIGIMPWIFLDIAKMFVQPLSLSNRQSSGELNQFEIDQESEQHACSARDFFFKFLEIQPTPRRTIVDLLGEAFQKIIIGYLTLESKIGPQLMTLFGCEAVNLGL
jgi:hypothetical protein